MVTVGFVLPAMQPGRAVLAEPRPPAGRPVQLVLVELRPLAEPRGQPAPAELPQAMSLVLVVVQVELRPQAGGPALEDSAALGPRASAAARAAMAGLPRGALEVVRPAGAEPAQRPSAVAEAGSLAEAPEEPPVDLRAPR